MFELQISTGDASGEGEAKDCESHHLELYTIFILQPLLTNVFGIDATRTNEMPALDIIDHSPRQPDPSPPVSSASNLVLIDNYDSFTWNVYQYLVLEGATVTVYRNDEIGLNDLIAQEPTQIVISPGPGHPESDAGISKDAIRHFAGKIPILGVCMGE